MAKDYAAHKNGKRQTHTGGGALPGWLWALIGLSLGLCIAALAFILLRPVEDAAPPPRTAAPQAQKQSPDLPPATEPRFKFYDLLPKSEVQPSEEPYRPEPQSEDPTATSARYLIQAGSFARREDAERRRASIALIGIESSIREVDIPGKGLRYRIQIGPAMDHRQAEKTMRQLADNDIDSFATRAGG